MPHAATSSFAKTGFRKPMTVAILMATISAQAIAAAESKEFDYPELLVSPSASERLVSEAKSENRSRWSTHWTIQAAALAAVVAGGMSNNDPGKNAKVAASKGEEPSSKSAAKAATYVGGFWLITTTAMSAVYTPYKSGLARLQGMQLNQKKDRLAYERYAEEALDAPSRVATVMKWAAFASTAGAGAMVIDAAANNTTKTFGGLAVIASSLPLLFESPWISVNRFQGEYKKRIYGPLTKLDLSLMPKGEAVAVVSSAAWEF